MSDSLSQANKDIQKRAISHFARVNADFANGLETALEKRAEKR
jgi:catalase